MKPNEGKTDRIIRAVLGIMLGIVSFYLTGTLQTVGWIFAIILILTALVGFCGLYALFGINTCSSKK
jgi:hypothetical protein